MLSLQFTVLTICTICINMKIGPKFAHSMYLLFYMVPVIRKINRSYFFEKHYLTSLCKYCQRVHYEIETKIYVLFT